MTDRYNSLYKFASLEIAETIALTATLKFSNPSRFNDPFDCDISRVSFEFCEEDENVAREINIIRNHLYPNMPFTDKHLEEGFKHAQIDKVQRSSVCCFSAINDNLLLWAHYANKHLGACLVFDNTVQNKFVSVADEDITQIIVDYKEFNTVNYFQNQFAALKNLFGTKSADWSYEKEFRFVLLEQEGLFKFNPSFLKGIIFGVKTSEQDIERFKLSCVREKVNIFFKRAYKHLDKLVIIDAN